MTRPPLLPGALLAGTLLLLSAPRKAQAHEAVEPPRPKQALVAPWPDGNAEAHDVLVPLELAVSKEGAVTAARVEATLTPELDAAALAAVWRVPFEPARVNGVAQAAKIRVLMRFLGAPKPVAAPAKPVPARAKAKAPAKASASPAPASPGGSSARPPAEILVAGERGNAPSASAVVIRRPVIEAAPHRTAADLMLLVPGISITQHSGEGKAYQIFYRGFDAVHGQDLEIWAGGAPVNDVSNIHGQGYADLNFIMPEVVKSIRAEPGTYDPEQGDFAVAGSLRLDLGYAEAGLTGKATLGNFGSRRYFLGFRPRGAPDTTFFAFETYATDGFGPSRAARRSSGVAQATFAWGHGVSARVLATGYAARFDSAGVLRLSDIESGAVDRFATYDPKQGGSASRESLVLEVQRRDDETEWSLASYAVLHSMRLRQNYTGFLPDTVHNDASGESGNSEQQLNDAVTLGAKARYTGSFKLFSRPGTYALGLSARTDWIDQSQRRLSVLSDQVTLDEVNARVRATDLAGWFDVAFHPIRRLTLRAGARLDGLAYSTEDRGGNAEGQARSAAGAHLGKKASASVVLTEGLLGIVSYGEGFRGPQARSLSEGETTPFTEVTSFEAGFRYRERRLQASLAGFGTLLSEDLAFNQSTARNEVTPPTRRTGVAAEFTAAPVDWFVSSASFTYTRAEFRASGHGYEKGALVPYSPQLVGRTDLAVLGTLGGLLGRKLTGRLGLASTFLGRRPLPYNELGHDVFLIDARGSLRLQELEVALDLFNLLDADWYDGEFVYASNFTPRATPSLVPARHVTAGAPRTLWLSLALHL